MCLKHRHNLINPSTGSIVPTTFTMSIPSVHSLNSSRMSCLIKLYRFTYSVQANASTVASNRLWSLYSIFVLSLMLFCFTWIISHPVVTWTKLWIHSLYQSIGLMYVSSHLIQCSTITALFNSLILIDLPKCLPACFLSVCLYVWLCVRPSVCLPVCLSVRSSVCLPVRLSVCPSVRSSVHLSVCPSVRLSLSVCMSICIFPACCTAFSVPHFGLIQTQFCHLPPISWLCSASPLIILSLITTFSSTNHPHTNFNFCAENQDEMFLQHICIHLQEDLVSKPRKS
jgi:hypothetical protein